MLDASPCNNKQDNDQEKMGQDLPQCRHKKKQFEKEVQHRCLLAYLCEFYSQFRDMAEVSSEPTYGDLAGSGLVVRVGRTSEVECRVILSFIVKHVGDPVTQPHLDVTRAFRLDDLSIKVTYPSQA